MRAKPRQDDRTLVWASVRMTRVVADVDSGPQEREHPSATAEFYVNQATVPLGVAVFTCACGATRVQHDLERSPNGWSAAADGSDRCPHCASSERTPKSGRPGPEGQLAIESSPTGP
jgi:hypothetical protein